MAHLGVDSRVVPEVLDVQVLNELLLLLLGQGTVEELADLVDDRAEISLHVFIKTERKAQLTSDKTGATNMKSMLG